MLKGLPILCVILMLLFSHAAATPLVHFLQKHFKKLDCSNADVTVRISLKRISPTMPAIKMDGTLLLANKTLTSWHRYCP